MVAVGLVCGDISHVFRTGSHQLEDFSEAGNNAADIELHGLASRRVEFLAVDVFADIFYLDIVGLAGLGAAAFVDNLVADA